MSKSLVSRLLYVLLIALLLAACGGRTSPTPITVVVTATPEDVASEPNGDSAISKMPGSKATPEEDPSGRDISSTSLGAVSTLNGVKGAIIQIEAQGSFVDPQVGLQLNAAGRGSGFFISPSGMAITNNHVAAGAAFLKVWLEGETRPRNARVLGVSECSDLAVIQVEGDNLPYLEWYEGEVEPGLEVYAAGFPLGDPEYSLNRGIVSKARADGRTDWSSVRYVIEHDARINPGSSGGPLVTSDGKVVGVNYASRPSAGQSLAIGRTEAQSVVEQLAVGQDVTSIGVNGQVVQDESGLSGIWVASVESGSPADLAGIRGGDIIVQLEGLVLGTDGTMADYCDVLRSHLPTDPLAITVLRFETNQMLEGQLNGRELKVVQTLGIEEIAPVEEGSPPQGGSSDSPTMNYVTVHDDSGALEVEVPASWREVNGDYWYEDGNIIGSALLVAPDIQAFLDGYDAPGLLFVASNRIVDEYTVESFLDWLSPMYACSTNHGRDTYDDGLYEGMFELFTGCEGDDDAMFVSISAMPAEQNAFLGIMFQASSTDFEVLERMVGSFRVVGPLP